MSDFCNRLQALMAAKGLRQSDMARRMGVGRTAAHNWYWGITEPNIDTLVRLRRILGCTWDELLGR